MSAKRGSGKSRPFDGSTTLVVELEVPDEWAHDMQSMWSEAIVRIKHLAERA